ncbi:ribonuclease H-like YkuK family protein [Candidatus Microgenomates bacterium]|nr:ribonuclease H-like YkuK family protein [Candidatus Microgenomates bacterium]
MFHSPTHGQLNLSQVRKKTLSFMEKDPEAKYRIVVGTDSAPGKKETTDFITALVVHRIGKGAIYFWQRKVEKRRMALRQKIYQEAVMSLEFAEKVLTVFAKDGINRYDVEIHVDIGKFGDTREMISEVVGMIRGSGFLVKTKPESYAASTVADRHT